MNNKTVLSILFLALPFLALSQTGNVGIGTSDIRARLEVSGGILATSSNVLFAQEDSDSIPGYLIGQFQVVNDSAGFMYDPSGPLEPYGFNLDATTRISLGEAELIRLTVLEFETESPNDSLTISTVSGNTIAVLSGSASGVYNIYSDCVLRFVSDGQVNGAGFVLRWDKGYALPDEGAVDFEGGRFQWYPDRYALRSGVSSTDINAWTLSNIGRGSAAWGRDTEASGDFSSSWGFINVASGAVSTSWGARDTASGDFATSWGVLTRASGNGATSWGTQTEASGIASTAWGNGARATSDYATAWGDASQALGTNATAWGLEAYAFGMYSTAWGNDASALGDGSTAWGEGTIAKAYLTTALGRASIGVGNSEEWIQTDPLFEIGNGVPGQTFSNAFTVLKNGNVSIGGFTPKAKLEILDGRDIGLIDDGGWIIIGDSTSQNLIFDRDEIDAYNNGQTTTLFLNKNGGPVSISNNGIIYDDLFYVVKGTQVQLGLGGYQVIGSVGGRNMVFDFDQIQARNNSNPELLRLNRWGGDVQIGSDIVIPGEPDPRNNLFLTGDLITGDFNSVINAGGGLMSTTINYIGDSFVAPSNVDGDEDLYIADDLEVGGSAFKPGGGVWTTASDQRLKREIKSFNTGLDAVLAIEPVTFVYNDRIEALNTGETYVGILAQDMLEIAPHTISLEPFGRVVVETDDGTEQVMDPGEEFYTYDASSLPYMLINAVQEQQDMIDQQQATIESQNELIQELLERVEALEEN